ncbi:MAG: hypothetical protein Q9195_000252 [Heterodermia aff. obscurata]
MAAVSLAMDTPMRDVEHLVINSDILYEISRQVYNIENSQGLTALCLVSRRAQAAAVPWLYRSLKIHLGGNLEPVRQLLRVLQRPWYQKIPRQIAIHCQRMGGIDLPTSVETLMEDINRVLSVFTNLEHFSLVIFNFQKILHFSLPRSSSWYGPGLMSTDLYRTLQKHPCHPKIIQGLSLQFPPATTTNLADSRLRITQCNTAYARSTVRHLMLSRYSFTAQPSGLQVYLDFSRLSTLELQDCQDVGYLFNNILCNISQCRIKVLKIDRAANPTRFKTQGYLGLPKIEAFLHLHKGMEKLTLSGMEGSIDPRAIAAQGRTLTHLTLQGFKPPRKGAIYTPSPLPLLTLEETLDMCAGLPELKQLQIDATCDDMFLTSAPWPLRQNESLRSLGVSLFPFGTALDEGDMRQLWNTVASPRLRSLEVWSSGCGESKTAAAAGRSCHWLVEREADGFRVSGRA